MLSSAIPMMSSDVYAADGDIITTISVGSTPWGIAFDSTNNRMYVVNFAAGTVSVINTATNAVVDTISVGSNAYGIAFDSTNNRMYVANHGSNTVSVINTATNAVDATITGVGTGTRSIAFDSTNNRMYVTNDGSNTVSVINTATNAVDATITGVGSNPYGIAFDSTNNRMYVADNGGVKVSVINTATNAVVDTISLGSKPYDIAFDSTNNRMYVTNNAWAKVSVIDVNSVTAPAQVGTVTITPGTDTTALSWSTPANGGAAITDYLISISPDGTNWTTFSDGTSTATTVTVTGLPKGTAYHFKVAAVNSIGTGSYSTSGSGTSFDYGESHTFTGTQSFDTGTRFQSGTTFKANQDFSGGAMTFGANQIFDEGTKFAASQQFSGAQTFGNSQEFGSGGTFGSSNTWGTDADFSAGTQSFSAAQTFGNGAKFAAAQDFSTGGYDHDFTATAIHFGSSSTFSAGESFGKSANFSAGTQNFAGAMTFGEAVMFADAQAFASSMTFDKYQHFGDSTDFTDMIQTFKEGTAFGGGTSFTDGQELPTGTIPSFGVMLEAFTCVDAACKPTDSSKYLPPGGLLTAGVDPAASYTSISSDDTGFTVDGLGISMTFSTISTKGTIKTDLYDPTDVPASSADSSGKVTVSTDTTSVESVGSVINLSAGTASVSGNITIELPYLEANIPAGTAESDLVVMHYTGGSWVEESSCTIDTTNNTIQCIVTSLSPFGVGSSSPSSSGAAGGGSGNSCDSDGLDNGKSLMVYEVNYLADSSELLLKTYSTCGGIMAKVGTIYGTQLMGLSSIQPFMDENIVVYSTTLDGDVTEFTIFVENKKHDFNEKYYTRGNDLIQKYTGTTGYTSQQQGTSTVFSETTLLQEPKLDTTDSIPVWIKNNAEWWADDTIDDGTFTTSIEFLINENIIQVSTGVMDFDEMDSESIPVWIKNNAKWWAEGIISEDDFVSGIEYLVNQGIISVS